MTQLYKVVRYDNYDREEMAEYLEQDSLSKEDAEAICAQLQQDPKRSDNNWYKVREQEYRLWRGMADIVGEPE